MTTTTSAIPSQDSFWSEEFYRQVDTLVHRGYPEITGLAEDEFRALCNPLLSSLTGLDLPEVDFEHGTLPFVIVVKSTLVPATKAMELVERQGKTGITKLYPREPEDFLPIDSVKLPDNDIYLILDIDRGKESTNLPPQEALPIITSTERSPLTIDEGIAIVTHFPDFLMKNNCFSLLASRVPGDKRVPAIWINSEKHPNLGWCWDGNPHTWLGSASCRYRI